MFRRILPAFALFGALLLPGLTTPAVACPMCKLANETGSKDHAEENVQPKAYMYSILFMLAMPATLLTGFGIGFYRLSKKQWTEVRSDEDGRPDAADSNGESQRP